MQETNQPLLSICMPTYNRAEMLRETLTHLTEILDPSFEIVVSDNCSADHTVDVLDDFKKKWENFQYVRLRKEIPMMENQAVPTIMAKGKYYYVFHDDDRLFIEPLLKAIKIMEEREDIIGVFGGHQEFDPKTNATCDVKRVEEIQIFPQGSESKSKVINQLPRLLYPVARTEICRRFCLIAYDCRSWGQWQFVSRVLDHGGIAVIPDILYRHVQVEGRSEHNLTKGYHHDNYRADFEIYVGEMGCGNPQNAEFISNRTSSAYMLGVRFAQINGEWLAGRHFLFRARAYGLATDKQLLEYEQRHLVGMVAERLELLIGPVPDVRSIIIESHSISEPVRSTLAKVMPEMDIRIVNREELLELSGKPEEFVIAWDYQTLLDRGSRLEADQLRQCSLKDVFSSCCLLPGALQLE